MSVKTKIQSVADMFCTKIVKLTHNKFKVMSIDETIKKVVDGKLSVVRYGDGEILMMSNQMNESFQTYDAQMAKKLKMIAKSNDEKILICIPNTFDGFDMFNDYAKRFYKYYLSRKLYLWYRYFDEKKLYGNAFMSRCYIDLADKTPCAHYFGELKKIWADRNVVIIEGEFSRLGVNNDLFDGAKSISRILCPAKNAYTKYEEILAHAMTIGKDTLILLALGATATALAYDLANMGYQAVDIGHVDVEYEWMRMGATSKVPIPSKYVNEAGDAGHFEGDIANDKYKSEIIIKIK